ncbi:MAG TPA: hypothetical protein VFK74_04375 [Azospira sp.]|nr:hypothetical protein [Azospira sp.]
MSEHKLKQIVGLAILGLSLGAGSCLADKPSWAGGGKKDGYEQDDRHGRGGDRDRYGDRDRGDDRREHRDGDRRGGLSVDIRFGGGDRDLVRDYYGRSIRDQGCPPGLAKKHNGCLPPGQAKQWQRGVPLPRGVVIYDLPRDLSIRLGTPPAGYRYVRVASDILLIAVGTSMVVDAIEDLGGF